jgi:hypothetical protein
MQQLLDFVHEHAVEDRLCWVVPAGQGELELRWQRSDPSQWRLRTRPGQAPWQGVPRAALLSELERRGADMLAVERELHALVATQIAFAEIVLRDATRLLGSEAALQAREEFLTLLRAALAQLAAPEAPSLQVIAGDATESSARSGQLTLIR